MMKIDRNVLERKILLAINEIATNKDLGNKTLESIKERLYNKNILNASQLLNKNIPLSVINIQMLFALTEAIYDETGLIDVDPKRYFLDNEIEIFRNYKKPIAKEEDIDIEFDNMVEIREGEHWIGRISVKYLTKLYNNLKINYNPQTQREAGYFEEDGSLIFIPKTYPQSIREIKTAILDGTYEPDEITINLLKDGNEDFDYKNGKLLIYNGRLDIIDGWHRSSAILAAMAENPDLDLYFELRLVRFDVQKARDFIIQKNKQRKINEKHIRSMNISSYHNSITKAINESQRSDFKGKVVINRHLINRGYGLVTFDVIADAIEENFNIKTRSQSEKIQDYLIDFFNEIYSLLYDEINNNRGIYTKSFSFIGYIAIASELFNTNNWALYLPDILNEIDFTETNPLYQELKDYDIDTNISKANIKKISRYFKKHVKIK